MTTPVQFARGTLAAWLASTKVLLDGQLGVARHTDGTSELKVGNGADHWVDLDGLSISGVPHVIYTADYTTLDDAIDDAPAGCTVYLAEGTNAHTGDLVVDQSINLKGSGDGSILSFTNGGLVFDGDSAHLTEVGLHDLRITRSGTAGAALRFKGGGSGTGVAHFNVSNVRVSSSTGECLLIDGSYIGTFTACYWIGGVTGIKIDQDSVAGTVTGNNITFVGGETQGCGTAASLDTPLALTFVGHCFEGSTTAGIDLIGNAYGVDLIGCYWESNAGYDLRVGNSGTPAGVGVYGGAVLDGSSGKNNAFQLIRGHGVDIRKVAFNGYTAEPITVNEASAGAVRGEARFNTHNGSMGAATVALNGATQFNQTILGQNDTTATVAGTPVKLHKQYTITIDVANVAANTTLDTAVTATGVAVGDDITVHTNSVLEAGLTALAVATATDTITLRIANVTTAAINPVARNFRFRVWR